MCGIVTFEVLSSRPMSALCRFCQEALKDPKAIVRVPPPTVSALDILLSDELDDL
jgi:hypothetical protein